MISNYSGFKGQSKTTVAFVGGYRGPMGIRAGREERQMFLRSSVPILHRLKTMRSASERKRKKRRHREVPQQLFPGERYSARN